MSNAASTQPGPAFQPGDRVRVTAPGIFAGLSGEVTESDPAFPAAVMVRLRAGGREVEIGFDPRHLAPAD
jgi:transcription antitermination factor NusG